MKHISVSAFKEVVQAESANPSVDFINVCTPAEFKEKHIVGVRSVPLDTLANRLGELKDKKTIYVHCRTGNRALKAIDTLERLGVKADLVVVEGGLSAWETAGFATGSHTTRIPLMRQVLIAAGSFVCISAALALTQSIGFVWIALAVGAGLVFAGTTGWCGMAMVLSRMPWNK